MPIPFIWVTVGAVALLTLSIAMKDEVEFDTPFFTARGRNA